jgi:cell division protein FtsB
MDKKRDFAFLQSKSVLLVVAFLLFILLLSFFFGDRGIVEIMKMKQQTRRLEVSLQDLDRQKLQLASEIAQLTSSPLAIEKQAREKLWLMKKNEKVIVFEHTPTPPASEHAKKTAPQ